MECPFCQSQTSPYSKRCHACGKTIPPAQYLLAESGIVAEEPADAPAPRSSLPVRNHRHYRLARLGDRFIAFVLDAGLLFGLFAIVDAWAFMRWGTIDGTELQLTAASLLIAITLNATTLFLYGWLLEAGFGATLGKAMVGIRVVRTGYRHSALSACAVRNVLRILDGLGFYLVGIAVAGCSSVRQRIGDICAQTAVIEETFGIGTRILAIVLWTATLVGAAWAVPRICLVNNPVHTRHLSQVIVRVGRTGTAAYFKAAQLTVDIQLAPAGH